MEKNKPQNTPLESRKAAAFGLRQVVIQKRPLDGFFTKDAAFLALSEQDKAFAGRLVRSTLRHLGAIEASFAPYFERPIAKDKYIILAHIYLAAVQIAFENIPAYAAINSAVDLVKKDAPKFQKLANAVLRRWLREHDDGRSFEENPNHNIPTWLSQKWQANYGGELRAISKSLTHEPPLDLTFKSADARSRFLDALGDEAETIGESVRVYKKSAVTALPEYSAGHWWVQDVAASLPAYLLGNVEGKRVLDMCAAPGGKTMQLAAMGAQVDALDNQEHRLAIVDENLKRMELSANVQAADAMKWQSGELYDAVLLDAPCSATGTLRRNPDIKYVRTAKSLLMNVNKQEALLRKGLELVKPGGKLVYCVCSMEMEEGEDIIQKLLDERKDITVATDRTLLPISVLASGDLGLRTHPGLLAEDGGMDGFFMTCLEKK